MESLNDVRYCPVVYCAEQKYVDILAMIVLIIIYNDATLGMQLKFGAYSPLGNVGEAEAEADTRITIR